ncbi:hypothetical protein EXIGLDRAFT_743985 [Exidia glandulosa HHB12029]|uniref:Hydrophobin n=1 Tax=Exidia glandulosa HHB12029 TaxID=1314781 RepID=A0A165QGX9_EXIGL|nr:hypothetical protein EXIGLDRAFT_743985 [Exidia glandulosa HHB12029]
MRFFAVLSSLVLAVVLVAAAPGGYGDSAPPADGGYGGSAGGSTDCGCDTGAGGDGGSTGDDGGDGDAGSGGDGGYGGDDGSGGDDGTVNACDDGDTYCCNSWNAPAGSSAGGLASVPIALIANLQCSRLSILSILLGSTCSKHTVCCQNVATNGLINIQCLNL